MTRGAPSLWYLWAALFGVVAALVAALAAMAWIRLGIDPWLAARGVPGWAGHGAVAIAVIVAVGWAMRQVRAPH
ncbi:hypothetical protein GGQ62_001301 [Polymorphobacter fuscus]|nr:hypothetical protein [Polymorphobacter fuscus]NJC08303.1 hypothetical protein [Polymorphobacter fuscus]